MSKDSRLVFLVRIVWIGMLAILSGCAASNAVLNRAQDQKQVCSHKVQQMSDTTPSEAGDQRLSQPGSEHCQTVLIREGNALWYGLMPLAVVTDIVIAPVQFVGYVRYVRGQNARLEPQ